MIKSVFYQAPQDLETRIGCLKTYTDMEHVLHTEEPIISPILMRVLGTYLVFVSICRRLNDDDDGS